jgi:hypothetical protein
MTTFGTQSPDLLTQPFSLPFPMTGDFPVSCVDHPTAGTLEVHVVN